MESLRSGCVNSCRKLNEQAKELLQLVRSVLFPDVFDPNSVTSGFTKEIAAYYLSRCANLLRDMLGTVLDGNSDSDGIICDFLDSLPVIAETLETDVEAAYAGDPAAVSRREVMLSYPTFEALSIFRIAHKLYELKVPLIPRMMTEYAHSKTGIDIHPGATIGRYFFIDHGTGVVIGETCTIGEHVKLYQGVTLGAKSFELDSDGNPVKGIKRHPDIGNNVVVYADATILGGNTCIGDDCVIGGNVWLTHSVEAGQTVYNDGGSNKKFK